MLIYLASKHLCTSCCFQGFVSAVGHMRTFVPAIYDVTVAIPKTSPAPTMLRLFKGQPSVVIYCIWNSWKECLQLTYLEYQMGVLGLWILLDEVWICWLIVLHVLFTLILFGCWSIFLCRCTCTSSATWWRNCLVQMTLLGNGVEMYLWPRWLPRKFVMFYHFGFASNLRFELLLLHDIDKYVF